jgi:hypothetical protein
VNFHGSLDLSDSVNPTILFAQVAAFEEIGESFAAAQSVSFGRWL